MEFTGVLYLIKMVMIRAHTLECTEKAQVSGTCILALMLLGVKTLSLNLALTLGCLNPKNLNTNPNPDPNSNPNPNNCGYESPAEC